MSNGPNTSARREEELAFRILETVLQVDIKLADARNENAMPDGQWSDDSASSIVEVTSPPATKVMRDFATATKKGTIPFESGVVDAHINTLGDYLEELVAKTLSSDVQKLATVEADERHLFLLPRTSPDAEYFARLSDTYSHGHEPVRLLSLPSPLTDVWFQGRAIRGNERLSDFSVRVARFNITHGWTRHDVQITERDLPSPSIGEDSAPHDWRSPKSRTQ